MEERLKYQNDNGKGEKIRNILKEEEKSHGSKKIGRITIKRVPTPHQKRLG